MKAKLKNLYLSCPILLSLKPPCIVELGKLKTFTERRQPYNLCCLYYGTSFVSASIFFSKFTCKKFLFKKGLNMYCTVYIQSRGFLYICSKIITMLTWICNFSNSFHVHKVFLTRWSALFCKARTKLKMSCKKDDLRKKNICKNFLFWELENLHNYTIIMPQNVLWLM